MVVLALPVFRFVEPCEPSYPARVAGYDDLGIWHDPGNGQFAKPGWSTAKGLVLDMVGDLLNSAREHVRHAPEGRALTVKDSRLTGIGVGAGDNVRVRYLNDEFGIVDVRRSGERRPHLVPWSRFSDTIPDPSAPVVDNPEFVNAPAVHEESSGLVDRLAANGGVGFVEVVGNDLNRYGVAAGSVLEARLGDDGAVTVTTPDGTRFRVPSRLVEPSTAPPDTPRTTEPGSAPDDVSAHTGVHVDDRREDSVGVPDRPSTPDIEAEPDDVDEADGSEPLTPPTTPEPDDEPDVQAEPEPEPGPDPIQEPDKIDEIPDPDIDPDEPEIPDDEDDGEVPVPRVGTREAWIADAVADHGVTREQVLDAYRDITGLRAEMRRQARAAQVPLLQTIDRVDALKVARPPAKKPVKQADGRTVWTRGAGSGEWDWFDHLGKAERNRIRNKWMVATRGEESAQASYAPDQLQQNIELAGVSGDVSTVDGAMQWWLDQIRMIDGLGNIALGRSAFNMDALGIELDGVKPSDILGRDRWDAAGAVAAARAAAADRYSSEEADMASQYLAAAYRAPEGERPWEIGYVRWVAELDDYLDAADAYEQDGRPVPDDITERIEQLLPLGSDPDQSLEEMYSDIAEMARVAGETVTGDADETGVSEPGQGDTPADRSPVETTTGEKFDLSTRQRVLRVLGDAPEPHVEPVNEPGVAEPSEPLSREAEFAVNAGRIPTGEIVRTEGRVPGGRMRRPAAVDAAPKPGDIRRIDGELYIVTDAGPLRLERKRVDVELIRDIEAEDMGRYGVETGWYWSATGMKVEPTSDEIETAAAAERAKSDESGRSFSLDYLTGRATSDGKPIANPVAQQFTHADDVFDAPSLGEQNDLAARRKVDPPAPKTQAATEKALRKLADGMTAWLGVEPVGDIQVADDVPTARTIHSEREGSIVVVNPSMIAHPEDGGTSLRFITHEAAHTISPERTLPGFSHDIEEGGAELLSQMHWAESYNLVENDAIRADGRWVGGPAALWGHGAYHDLTRDLLGRVLAENPEVTQADVKARLVALMRSDHYERMDFHQSTDGAPPATGAQLAWLLGGDPADFDRVIAARGERNDLVEAPDAPVPAPQDTPAGDVAGRADTATAAAGRARRALAEVHHDGLGVNGITLPTFPMIVGADRSAETDMRPEANDSADGGSPGAHTDAAEPPPIPFHRPTKRMSPTSVGNMVAAGEPLWHYSEVADDAQSMALLRTQVAVNMYDPAELSEDMDGTLGTLLWRENRGYKLSPDDVSMLGVARHEPEAVGRLFAKFRRQYEGKAANSKIPAEVELSADVRADAHAAWTETVTHPALVAAFDTIGVDPPNMILSRWREPWDDDRDANGTYTAGSNTVWINSTDFWGGISAGLSNEEARSFPISITERAPAAIGAATTSGGDRRGVMIHETGHYVHDHLAAGGGFVGTPLADEWKQMWGAYHDAYIAATEAASGVPGGIAGLHRKQLSFYSHENFKEGFAETFGLVARGADPEGLDPEGRALFDWMSTNVFGLAPGESFADIEVGQTYSVNGVKIERTANGYVDVATGEPVNANGRPL